MRAFAVPALIAVVVVAALAAIYAMPHDSAAPKCVTGSIEAVQGICR